MPSSSSVAHTCVGVVSTRRALLSSSRTRAHSAAVSLLTGTGNPEPAWPAWVRRDAARSSSSCRSTPPPPELGFLASAPRFRHASTPSRRARRLRALGETLQERVCFSHDLQSCLSGGQPPGCPVEFTLQPGDLGLLGGEPADFRPGRLVPKQPGVAVLAPLADQRGIQALAAQIGPASVG